MASLTFLLLALLHPQDPAPRIPPASPWHTVRLDNGVRVNVLQVDAPKVTVFSFLPMGLDGDPPGRAQFSHLAEHMLIRSTDPRHLSPGGMQLNGETTNQVLRLESIAEPESWRQAVLRHPRWLMAREFDEEVLAREKVRIAGEERMTVPRGFNHKWATAAWAQIVGGRDHAAVHGDVANATMAQLRTYVAAKVKLTEAQIFVIGPCPAKDVVAAVREGFAKQATASKPDVTGTTSRPGVAGARETGQETARETAQETARKQETAQEAARKDAKEHKPGHRAVTWDLEANHYLEWYELPADTTAAEAEVLAQLLSMACFQDRTFTRIPGRAVAGSVSHAGKRFVLLSSNLPEGTKVAELQAAFRAAIARASKLAPLQVQGAALAGRFERLPDFAAQRRQVQDPRFRDLVEANFAMQCGYACARLGVAMADVPAAYRALDAGRIVAMLAGNCAAQARHSVRISRRAPRKPPG